MIAGILLAAGESTRMGQPKALLPWRGTTLLQSQIVELHGAALGPVIVVLGHHADELSPLIPSRPVEERGGSRPPEPVGQASNLPDVRVIVNSRYREGRSTSVIAGLSALPHEVEAVIMTSVDQPTDADIVRKLVEAFSQLHAPITLPSIHHRRGHPALFDRALFPEMLAITEEGEGLREVMTRHAAGICYVNFDIELVRTNLNSPADYEAAYALWGQR